MSAILTMQQQGWDAYAGKLGADLMERARDRLTWLCEQVQGAQVLEADCGLAADLIMLARAGKAIVGVCGNATAYRQALAHITDEPSQIQQRITLFEGSLETATNLVDRSFDTIILNESIAVSDRPHTLIEIAFRKLKPEGTLITLWPLGVHELGEVRRTVFVREPARHLARHFDIQHIHVLGGTIAFVSKARKKVLARSPKVADWPDTLMQELETALEELVQSTLDKLHASHDTLAALEKQYASAADRLQALDARYAEYESHAATLRAENDALQHSLREAERAAEQKIESLKSELRARRSEQEQAAQQASQLQAQLRISELEQAQQVAVLRHEKLEREVRISELEKLTAEAQRKAVEAKAASAEAARQLQTAEVTLAVQREQFQQRLDQLQSQLASKHEEISALRDGSALAQQQAHEQFALLVEEKATEARKAIALQSEVQKLTDELSTLHTNHQRLSEQYRKTEQALRTLESQLQTVKDEYGRFQQSAAARAEELAKQADNVQSQLSSTTSNLQDAQLKYRELLKQYRDAQARDKASTEKLRHLERRVRNLQREKEQALQQVEQTRSTQSFRLGYTLLHGFKSWGAFSRLPADLLRIRRDAKERRRRKALQHTAQAGSLPRAARNSHVATQPRPPIMLVEPSMAAGGALRPMTRIAAIMDEFTFHSYAPECELLQLRPETWRTEIETFKPDLVFIESAWKGVDDLWQRKVSNCTEEVRELLEWAKSNNIPSLFWNKEDPVHFSTFIELASRVDHVFTTDIDCIPKYKKILGHNRVYLLPFAAQPATHNPIETHERKDAFNFAGSYYLRYPERQRDFAALIDTVQQFRPVEIYDRNYEKPHPHYQFPEKYAKYILGSLKFDEIDKAYKGYRYGINMNTIKQSQTMFARRVFELLASNTVVVSNFSRGVRLLFGDLVISSDNADQISSRVRTICDDETHYRKFRLAGLRKVMREHTYRHRLSYIKAKLSNKQYVPNAPGIAFVSKANTHGDLQALVDARARQTHSNCRLFILTPPQVDRSTASHQGVECFDDLDSLIQALRDGVADYQLVGVLHPDDYYGPCYAEDIAWALTYGKDAQAFGKSTVYTYKSNSIELVNDGGQYRFTNALPLRSSAVTIQSVTDQELALWIDDPDAATTERRRTLSLDEFNYLANGRNAPEEILATILDLQLPLSGVSFSTSLASLAESLTAIDQDQTVGPAEELPSISGPELAQLFNPSASKLIIMTADRTKLRVKSNLPPDKYAYIYLRESFRREDINMILNSQFSLICDDPGEVKTVFEFQDGSGQKISHSMLPAAGTHALAIPNECVYIRFGLRMIGTSDIKIHKLVWGTYGEKPLVLAGRSSTLILTKQYPAYDDLYRYGFLHTRVRAYQRAGERVDIFRISNMPGQSYREFENVDVASGDTGLLRRTLASGQFRHVLVHILDKTMWDVLKDFVDNVKITVWAHGSEIQSWQRRAYEFSDMTPEQVARKKKLGANRMAFWRAVLTHPSPNLRFVFVSNWLKHTTEEDVDIPLTGERYQVIPNYVDTTVFSYRQKKETDRKKLLSIRPYTSNTYANDITVSAILELSKEPYFDQLEIELCGDGDQFEQITAPISHFRNVKLSKGFLTHDQIANKHKNYGVFLTPSRMDTQGVSRDEAMASGLVPIATNVAAVPEFLSDDEGYICPLDPRAVAAAVNDLVENPEKFLQKSRAARTRVATSLDYQLTIGRELSLFRLGSDIAQ